MVSIEQDIADNIKLGQKYIEKVKAVSKKTVKSLSSDVSQLGSRYEGVATDSGRLAVVKIPGLLGRLTGETSKIVQK